MLNICVFLHTESTAKVSN